MIRRVFIRARQQFGLQAKDIDISKPDMQIIEVRIFPIRRKKTSPLNKSRHYPLSVPVRNDNMFFFSSSFPSQLYLISMIYVPAMLQNDVLNVKVHIIFVNVVQN
jgi:hypothetical protein